MSKTAQSFTTLTFSAAYLIIFTVSLTYLTVKRRGRYTIQIKIVIFMLFMAAIVQITGCYLAFVSVRKGTFKMLEQQSLYHVSQSFTMVIYNSMVCRMCYIYDQIVTEKAQGQPQKTCRLATARLLVRFQVTIISIYFISANVYYSVSYCFQSQRIDKDRQTEAISLGFGLLNFCIELAWGIAFCILWRFMSNIARQHDSMISQRQLFCANMSIAMIMIFYFAVAVVFEFFDPVLTYIYEVKDSGWNWVDIFYRVYYLRFIFDSMSCLMILVLMYRFSPKTKDIHRRL